MTQEKNQHVSGLMTAIGQIESILPRIDSAVESAEGIEGKVLDLKNEIAEKKSADKMFALMLSANPDAETRMIDGIAGLSRKAVSEQTAALQVQLSAIQEHLREINTKYGQPQINVKRAHKGEGTGTLNLQNATLAKDELTRRGFSNVEIVPIESAPGYHLIKAVSPDGTFRQGRYYNQILKDWL